MDNREYSILIYTIYLTYLFTKTYIVAYQLH